MDGEFPFHCSSEPVLSPGAGVALPCEGGQDSPFPASPEEEDGRRQLLPAQHLPFPSLHTLAQESKEASDRS